MSDETLPPIEREISASVEVEFDAAAQATQEKKQENLFDAAQPNKALADQLQSKTTPEELIEAILAAPDEQLIPWEDIHLPSRGLYYNGQIPGGMVRIKAMGTTADKILATARLAQTGQSIDYLLDNCVQLPGNFPTADLLAGDRTFLLYALRGITHGNKYEFMMNCPSCDVAAPYEYDLNDLASTITYGNPNISEPAKVVLPYLSSVTGNETWVSVRFLRGRDISALAQRQRFNKKIQGGTIRAGGKRGPERTKAVTIDSTLTENLNLIIVSFMGTVTDPGKLKALTTKFHSSDLAAIREFLRKHSPGIDVTMQVTCPECSAEFRTELPITEAFFRPAESRRV